MVTKAMKTSIRKILLSSETELQKKVDVQDAHTDVIVEMNDGEKYVASFFTYKNMKTLQLLHREENDFLGGKYFWVKGMLMVESCTRQTIEKVVLDLMEEGDFERVFRKIN